MSTTESPANILKFFATLIESELGISYPENIHFQLQNRLEEIVLFYQLKDINELYVKAQCGMDASLKQLLLDTATNNETSFYRDPKIFQVINNFILPKLIERRNGQEIRLWSAASSFGQEAYTLAMILDSNSAKYEKLKWSILGTDVAERVVRRANQARFSQLEVQRGLPTRDLIKYFDKDSENFWTPKAALKAKVRFERGNLLHPEGKRGNFDLILCRNVLIYQQVENKKKIINYLLENLEPHGFLIMGAGESMIGITERFNQVNSEGAIFYQPKPATAELAAA